MKKPIILLALFLCVFTGAFAQRHLKGIKSLDILGGKTGKGYYGEVGYNRYLTNKFYINLPVRAELAKINDVKLYSFSFNPSINYTVLKPTEWLFLSVKAGGSAYLDQRSSALGDSLFYKSSATTFNFGVFGGAEAEIYISDKVVWVINFRQNYNFVNYPGNWVWYAGTGLRLNIF